MPVEIVIVASVLVSVITALGGIILKLKMKNCRCGSMSCECSSNSNTPPQSPQPKNKEESEQPKKYPIRYKLTKRISGIFKNTTSV